MTRQWNRPAVRLDPSETQIQIALIEALRLQRDERRFAFHIPNEAKRSKAGHGIQAAMGTRTGAADVFVPMARGGWNGAFIELKSKDKKPTQEQLMFGVDMNECGFFWCWSDNLDEAMKIMQAYADGHYLRPNWAHYGAPVKKVEAKA